MRRRTTLAVLALLAGPLPAWAGAWPEPPGGWLDINTLSYYQVAVQGYNQFGKPAGRGTYSQIELSPYVEYGLTDRLTLGLQPRLQEVTQSGLPGTMSSSGLVQANIFARYELYHDGADVVSAQGQIGIPGSATRDEPELAQPEAEYEARVLYGRNLSLPSHLPGFVDAEAGYRFEEDGASNQIRGDLTLGLTPAPHWQILAQSFNTFSTGGAKPDQSDYNLYRVEASAVRDVGQNAAVQFGLWHDAGGHNISLGNAGILALWLRF